MKKQELVFNALKHEYRVGKVKLTPVSTVLNLYFGDFDKRALARKVNKIPNSKYYKMGVRKILAGWKAIADEGTLIHKEIEDFILLSKTPNEHKALQAIKYLNEEWLPTIEEPIMLPEMRVYDLNLGIAGTVDMPIIDELMMTMSLGDWKTNEKIDDKEYQKMKIQVGDLKNTKLQRYQMQLSIYAYILKLNKWKIKDIRIIQLTNDEKPNIYILPILYDNAKYMCENYWRLKNEQSNTNREESKGK
jgi:CRISPR/Cas system-associated protein endoribonuclease Cas2